MCLSCADKLCKNPSCPVSKRALLYASPIGELDEICRALEKLLAEYDEYAQRVQNLMPVQRAESKPALSPTGEVVADSKPPASFKIGMFACTYSRIVSICGFYEDFNSQALRNVFIFYSVL